MTKTKIISTKYDDGQRISEAVITVDRSDDLYTLAALQRQYESVRSAIAEAKAKGTDTTAMEKDLVRIKAQLDEQQAIVDGYTKSSN